MKPLTIVCISDTHELHRELDVPNGDILIHAGDFTMFSKSAAAILDFNQWLGNYPTSGRLSCLEITNFLWNRIHPGAA
jgi:hypothetical protein